jgi:hypothetical protein
MAMPAHGKARPCSGKPMARSYHEEPSKPRTWAAQPVTSQDFAQPKPCPCEPLASPAHGMLSARPAEATATSAHGELSNAHNQGRPAHGQNRSWSAQPMVSSEYSQPSTRLDHSMPSKAHGSPCHWPARSKAYTSQDQTSPWSTKQ